MPCSRNSAKLRFKPLPGSVDVFHAAVFADGQTLAGGLQFFLAHLVFLARFQAFGGGLMGGGHGPVALDVFLGFLVGVLRERY